MKNELVYCDVYFAHWIGFHQLTTSPRYILFWCTSEKYWPGHNEPFFIWDDCCHTSLCLHLMKSNCGGGTRKQLDQVCQKRCSPRFSSNPSTADLAFRSRWPSRQGRDWTLRRCSKQEPKEVVWLKIWRLLEITTNQSLLSCGTLFLVCCFQSVALIPRDSTSIYPKA